mmetsp:Transcript_17811/g.32859  ORF Transcript_17811/g.32859 Transcript_17811/m.32859 type:complete len:547 (-) Transcript_17811:74-1714(-)
MAQEIMVRRIAKFLVGLWLLRKLFRIVRAYMDIVRRHKILKKLPTIHPETKEHPLLGYVNSDGMLQGNPANIDAIKNQFVRFFREEVQRDPKLRREGVLNMWYCNSKIGQAIPNTMNQVIVFGMPKLRTLLATKNQGRLSKGFSYRVSEPLLGQGVLASSGPTWAHQRQVLDLGFKDKILKKSIPDITKTVMTMVNKWERFAANGTTIDALEESLKMTMDVLGKFAFSYDFGSVVAATTKDAPLYDSFTTILDILNKRVLIPPLEMLKNVSFLPVNRRFDKAINKIHAVVDDIVASRRSQRKEGDPVEDLLDIMLASSGSDTSMSDKEIGWNIATMLFAGHDTTAAQLSWLLYLLSTHTDTLVKLREEYESELGKDKTASPSFEQLESFKYLNAVLMEGLRLYPSAGFTKDALEDIDLDGHLIPRGTEILMLPYLAQRDPDYYEDPNCFKPERWLEDKRLKMKENVTVKSHVTVVGMSAPYLPFSLGTRSCVGKNLALIELRIAVVKLLQHFDFTFVPNENFSEDPLLCMTLNPRGIMLKATARSA